jgi:hypothetical protein
MNKNIIENINKLQPYYDKLCNKFSQSYLQGSIWYVGNNLESWWINSNNIRYFKENIRKLKVIIEIIKIELNYQIKNIEK